jgi:hypothetical protein
MGTEGEIRDAYRANLKAHLKEAVARGDRAAQQRITLMIELHDKGVDADSLQLDAKVPPAAAK